MQNLDSGMAKGKKTISADQLKEQYIEQSRIFAQPIVREQLYYLY